MTRQSLSAHRSSYIWKSLFSRTISVLGRDWRRMLSLHSETKLVPALLALWVALFAQLALSRAAGTGGEFDYSNGSKGQQNWGNLKEEWRPCKTGRTQSPIDVRLGGLQPICALRLLQARYNATSAILTNLDHDVGLEFPENAGTLVLDGTVYKLREYHIHSPSEHAINGRRYPVEGHLLHKSSDDKIAVVSVLYNIGKDDDAFIDQVEHLLPALKKDGKEHANLVDPSELNIPGKRFYRYKGSLTTPPCTEGVTWSILRKPRTLSQKQYHLLRDALKGDNSRSLHALNGREISYYK